MNLNSSNESVSSIDYQNLKVPNDKRWNQILNKVEWKWQSNSKENKVFINKETIKVRHRNKIKVPNKIKMIKKVTWVPSNSSILK